LFAKHSQYFTMDLNLPLIFSNKSHNFFLLRFVLKLWNFQYIYL